MIRFILSLALILLFPLHTQAAEKPFLPTHEVTTPAGLTFWFIEDHTQPIMALSFGFQGAGSVNDTTETQGLTRLLSNTLDEGAGPYDSRTFQEQLENNAIDLSFGASRDHFFGSLKTLTETRDTAVNLLTLALNQPRFDAEPIGRMIEANLTRIRSSQPDPDWLAARLMNDKAFGTHPYALNSGGTLSTLPKITPETLRQFKDNFLTRDRLKIGLVGDITQEQAMTMIDQIFAKLPAPPPHRRFVPIGKAPLQNTGKTFVFDRAIPQTVMMMMGPAPGRDDPDHAAFTVLNNILGGSGFGSRLMEQIRERAGLTYGIYSSYSTMDHISTFNIQTSTQNDKTAQLIDMARAEVSQIKTAPVPAKELEDARAFLLGSMPMALTSTEAVAGLFLEQQLDNRKIDGIDLFRQQLRDVTAKDLARVAQKWLDPKGFITVLIGHPTNIENAETVQTINNIE